MSLSRYVILLLLLLLSARPTAVFSHCKHVAKDRNTRDHSAWTEGNGDPMHAVYPTQYTSRMATAMVMQEVGADTRIIVKE